jgi:hypothetical protein
MTFAQNHTRRFVRTAVVLVQPLHDVWKWLRPKLIGRKDPVALVLVAVCQT